MDLLGLSALGEPWATVVFALLLGVTGLLLVGLLAGIAAALWAIGALVRRVLLYSVCVLSGISTVVLTIVTARLPVPDGNVFVAWHQSVKIGAAASTVVFVLCLLGVLLPIAMDRAQLLGFIPLVSLRHVRAEKSGFLTVISFFSIGGVFLSCLTLCGVISVMGGFGEDLKRKILGNNAHLKVHAEKERGFTPWREVLDDVRLVKGVEAATPIAAGEAMASGTSSSAGVLLRGVDTDTVNQVIDLEKNLEVGRFEYLVDPTKLDTMSGDEPVFLDKQGQPIRNDSVRGFRHRRRKNRVSAEVDAVTRDDDDRPAIILGRELARTLHVYVGDTVTLITPLGELGPTGPMPKTRRFRVAAVFYSGMYEFNASYAYVKLDVAQEFLDLYARDKAGKALGSLITEVAVRTPDPDGVGQVRDAVGAKVKGRPELTARDWKQSNKQLFSALALEKIVTFVILLVAILVASFCIVRTLLLMVTEKSKEIAVMKALGASNRTVLAIFMTEGVTIGAIGALFGVVTGSATMYALQQYGVRLDPNVYYIDRLPISVRWDDYILIFIAAIVITTLATIYPALSASRLRPVDGIRYE